MTGSSNGVTGGNTGSTGASEAATAAQKTRTEAYERAISVYKAGSRPKSARRIQRQSARPSLSCAVFSVHGAGEIGAFDDGVEIDSGRRHPKPSQRV